VAVADRLPFVSMTWFSDGRVFTIEQRMRAGARKLEQWSRSFNRVRHGHRTRQPSHKGFPMPSVQPLDSVSLVPTCPLCHTPNHTVTQESLQTGATWACTVCGQAWSAGRLQAVAGYAQYVLTHP
jgi:hypothetical protein